jgi:hypothetical protein
MEKEELKKKLNDLITKFIDENAYTQGEDHIQTHYTVKLLEYLGWQGKNAKIKKTQDIKNQKIPDITLKKDQFPLLIIESKNADSKDKLDHTYPGLKFKDQLMKYCSDAGIYWGILTNFVEWRIYNSHQRVLYKNKKYAFYKLLWDKTNKENYIDLLSDEGIDFLLSLSVENIYKNQGHIDNDPVYYPQQKNLEEERIKEEFFIKIKDWRLSFSLLLNEPCLGQEIFYIFAQQY